MKFAALFALALGLSVQPVLAHDDHKHETDIEQGLHGGDVRDAKPFKGELVLDGETVRVYIHKKAEGKLVPVVADKKTLSGDYQFPKEKVKKVTFNLTKDKDGNECYEAKIAGVKKVHRYDLHVNLEAGKEKAKVDFGIDNIH